MRVARCPSCGAPSASDARFCGSCGARLEGPAQPARAGNAAGVVATLALALGVATLALALVGRGTVRTHERAIERVRERVAALEGRVETIGGGIARLEERVQAAERRATGAGVLAERVLPSVYSLELPDGSAAGFAAWRQGTGTILLTAAHVVSGWEEVTVRRGERSWKGRVLEVDATNDLATVRVAGSIGRPLWPDPVTTLPKVGATLVLFGSPLGYEGTVTRGIVSRVAYNEIQTDAPANPGSSGGPALTEDGRLVGVVVSGYEGRDITFVVPVRRVCVKLRRC